MWKFDLREYYYTPVKVHGSESIFVSTMILFIVTFHIDDAIRDLALLAPKFEFKSHPSRRRDSPSSLPEPNKPLGSVSKSDTHPRKNYAFKPFEMAPKRKQNRTSRTKSSGTLTGTISPKPLAVDREEEANARALKRAARVEARCAEAEKRKEAVRPLLCHLCQHGGHRCETRQRRLTSMF
jgi:hypothetical protein